MMPEPGTALAGEGITLWDDGLLADCLGSAPCDDEGNPHQRRKLIDRGSFVGGLYDVLHGQLYNLGSTGNGHRRPPLFGHAPRFYFPPDAGPTTLVIDPGDGGPTADLLETVGEGVWLEQFGYPFPDPISGHFGGEIRLGYRISRGKLAGPIRGGTLGGPLLMGAEGSSVLRSVSAVGSESRTVGSLRTPPLVAKNVMVAGGP
jgi:PmbA protein